jgi:hypothetical protein
MIFSSLYAVAISVDVSGESAFVIVKQAKKQITSRNNSFFMKISLE